MSGDRRARRGAGPWLVAVGLAAALAAGLQARAADPPEAADAAAVSAVCARCHDLQLVQSQPRSEDEWMAILQKMADLGARGTDTQFDGVVRYLRSHLTLVNVNTASADELSRILDLPAETAEAIVARRERQPLRDLSDLSSVPGVSAAALDERKARIVF